MKTYFFYFTFFIFFQAKFEFSFFGDLSEIRYGAYLSLFGANFLCSGFCSDSLSARYFRILRFLYGRQLNLLLLHLLWQWLRFAADRPAYCE